MPRNSESCSETGLFTPRAFFFQNWGGSQVSDQSWKHADFIFGESVLISQVAVEASRVGKRNRTPPCSSEELFCAAREGGHRGKVSVVDMAFLIFIGLCIHHRRGKCFFLSPENLSNRFLWW